jgi:purine nucleosidase/pyrimidine-specific ribonucleoside hydrolase
MAVGYAIDPGLVKTIRGRVGVETRDGLTLGMTVPDRRHHHVWTELPEITIGEKADYGRFLQILTELILE